MQTIHTRGEPFDRGQQHGSQCRDLAAPWFEHTLQRSGDAGRNEVRTAISSWRQHIEAVHRDLIDECRGIAAGLDISEQDYFTALVTEQSNWLSPACTVCGVANQQRHALIAKTDDVCDHERGLNVLNITRPNHGYAHVQFHFAGTIWTTAGMNETGLAIGMTGIPGAHVDKDGLPSLFVLHTILPQCATADEVIDHVKKLPINAYGFSLQIADASGDLALIEATPAGVATIESDAAGYYAHTNHILDEDFARRNPSQTEPILTNGRRRLTTATRLLPKITPDEDGMREVLTNRDEVGPISQEGEDGSYTDYAVIFNPAAQHMTLWSGPPSRLAPQELDVAALLDESPTATDSERETHV